ncbi:Glycosyltransferase like family protein [Dyadobacter sp. SG02]|uniref:glycosyltransferase n=1 Tax=Dyadobacter sp. SG02 TaxID=1855291 RepID=UPI0008D8D3FC|nr:glycosyltransferase [Dyadobacter sp. SG02]SEJ79022.1 Glycosyltransferase like family protein [Dyadobacter sp. SG02]
MISVIICSRTVAQAEIVKLNVAETIGEAHECIILVNSDGALGIAECYNQGIELSKYEILCFMHDDVEMRSGNWGEIVVRTFMHNPKLGLLGIAGSKYKPVCPSSWYCDISSICCHYLQGFSHKASQDVYYLINPDESTLSQVASIDGCWMCTRKTIAQEIGFDSTLLKHFHGYDLDFSLAVGACWQIMVTFEILLRHSSEGKFGPIWFEEILKVHHKWIHRLPVFVGDVIPRDLAFEEERFFNKFKQQAIDAGIALEKLVPTCPVFFASRNAELMS